MKADAKATFLKLQECWSKRDYTEMAPLMQDGLYMQHVAQLEAMKGRHEINRMDDLKLLDLQLVLVNNMHDRSKDNFVAWVNASAKDTIVDDRTMNKIRGDVSAGVFEEFWAFKRDGDAWKLDKIDQPEEGMDVIVKENFDSISTQKGLEFQYEKVGGPKIKNLGIAATRERDEGAVGTGMDKIKWKAGRVGRLLNFLGDQDKIWDADKMVSYCRSMFIAFNVALELKSLDQIKDNLSPEAITQYQAMVDDLKAKNRKIEKRNLAVRDVEIVLVKNFYDNKKDEFTAWVSGQAQTVISDEKTGKAVEGDNHVADFEEYWTFRRDGDRWKLVTIESGFKKYVEEENFDEGSGDQLTQWYYTKDRAV
jgi:predicted lipid-binding transport protein (Tim44 family)